MLIIRKEQMKIFAQVPMADFVRRAVDHVKTIFPDNYSKLGECTVKESVISAIISASVYGLKTEYEILLFLNCMYFLGFTFDSDESLPWVSEILNDLELSAQVRINLLTQRMKDYLRTQPVLNKEFTNV